MKADNRLKTLIRWFFDHGQYVDEQKQSCKRCGMPDKFSFVVSDETWYDITHDTPYFNRVLCLDCFDELASEKDASYRIEQLFFVGKKLNTSFFELNQ